jgi:hypothetical protein
MRLLKRKSSIKVSSSALSLIWGCSPRVAEQIIELARRGERDPARLRERVLREAGGSSHA